MYSCSCRAHFFIHLHMYMSLHHCVTLWKCKKIQIPPWHRHFPSLWASSDNRSVCGLASLARRKPRFPRGRTSLRFLKDTKITAHEFLTKRRLKKTRNAIVIVFLRWQVTLFFTTGITTVYAVAFARTSSVTFALRAERALTTTSLWSYLTMRVRFGVLNVKVKKSRTFQAQHFNKPKYPSWRPW